MSVKAYNKEKESFVKIASLQSRDIAVDKSEFVSNNVSDALSELKRNVRTMQQNIAWIYNNGTIGGGGGSGSAYTGTIQVENFDDDKYLIIGDTDAVTVTFKIVSKLNNPFNVNLVLGGTTITRQVTPNTSTTVNFGQVASGTYDLKITATDYTGYPTEAWNGTVVKGALSVDARLGASTVGLKDPVYVYYTVKTSEQLKNRDHYVEYSLDGGDVVRLDNTKLNTENQFTINAEKNQMAMGSHTVVITAGLLISKLEYITISKTVEFNVFSENEILITVPVTTKQEYLVNQTVTIPFNVVASATNIGKGFVVNWQVYEGSTIGVNAIESGNVTLTNASSGYAKFFISTEKFKENTYYTIRFDGKVNNSEVTTTEPGRFTFKVVAQATTVDAWLVVQDGLIGHYDALGSIQLSDSKWLNKVANPIQYNPGDCIVVNPVSNPFPENIGITDASELNFLKLWGKSYAYVDFDMFGQGIQKNGATIEFVYRCRENGDVGAVVASYGYFGSNTADNSVGLNEGFCITANDVFLRYGANANSIPATYVMENEWIHCSIVFEPISGTVGMYTKVYLNGVLSAFQVFRENNAQADNAEIAKLFGKLCLGAKNYKTTDQTGNTVEIVDSYSDVEFRNLKIYSRALNAHDVVVNYIADQYYMHYVEGSVGQYDGDRNYQLRVRNGMINKDFNETSTNLPKIYIIPESATIADDFRNISKNVSSNNADADRTFDCRISYESFPENNDTTSKVSFNSSNFKTSGNMITGTYIKIQGTTSLQYTHKNYDICFGKWENNEDVLFTPKYGPSNLDLTPSGEKDVRKNWLPENIFTLKADLIDSSHANNVGTANAISEISESLGLGSILPPRIDNNNENAASVKYAIEGFPCLLYVYDNADGSYQGVDVPGTPSLYGVYMFDLGRTTVNNFGMQNLRINEWVQDKDGFAPCLVKSASILKPAEGNMYSPMNTFSFEGNANDTGENSAVNFTEITDANINRDWTLRYPTGEDAAAAATKARTSFKTAASVVSNYESDRDAFMIDGPWDLTSCITYLLCLYVFGMTDNAGKNLQVRTWDANKWFPMFYDMDTLLGVGNTGQLQYDTNVDFDEYAEKQADQQWIDASKKPTGDVTQKLTYGQEGGAGHGKGAYNTNNSRLWNAVRSRNIWYGALNNTGDGFTANSLREAYRSLRNNGTLTYNNLWKFYENIVNQVGQMFYNRDAEIKYLDENWRKLVNTNANEYVYPHYDMCHGTRELLTKRWLRDRLYYLDSLFEMDSFGEATKPIIWSRHNLSESDSMVAKMKTRCPVFVKQTVEGTSLSDSILCDKYYFGAFTGLDRSANALNVSFNNAPLLTATAGLHTRITQALFTDASNLLEISLPGATILTQLSLTSMRSLRKLEVTDSSALAGILDLSQSVFLNSVEISNTQVSTVNLPIGGTLNTFNASNTKLTSLEVVSQTMLETLNLTDCTELSSIRLTQCDSLKSLTITGSKLVTLEIDACPGLETIILRNNNSLKKITLKEGCENVKVIDLTGCMHQELAVYVEDDVNASESNALNFQSCVNLEELILTNCTAQIVALSDKCTSLKVITANNSRLKALGFYTDTGFELNKIKVIRESVSYELPTVDLSRFQNLESITFNQNSFIEAITGLNYSGNCSNIFNRCTGLYTVQGSLAFTKSTSNTFAYCSDKFRLCEAYDTTPLPNVPVGATSLKITINDDVTDLTSIFAYNRGITLYDIYYFCSKLTSGLTNATQMFYATQPHRSSAGYRSQNLSEEVLTKCTGLKVAYMMFSECYMVGTFPSRILKNCSSLTNVSNMFSWNSFDQLDNSFAEDIFANSRNIANCSNFLLGNKQLKNNNAQPIHLDKLFINLNLLENCSGFLGIRRTNPSVSEGHVTKTDDGEMDTTPRRALYIGFSSANQADKIFAKNPKLTNCSNAFSKCTFVGNAVLSENMFGGVSTTKSTDGLSASYPTSLTDVSYLFHDCDATLELTNKLFANLRSLTSVAGFVSGGYSNRTVDVGGTISRCNKVTGDIGSLNGLFTNNPGLTNVDRFFEGTGITGQISTSTTANTVSALFTQNVQLISANYLFRNATALKSTVPSLLFGKCTALQSIKGVFMGCTGMVGSLPGMSDGDEGTLFKNLVSDNNKYLSLTNVDNYFRDCVNLTSRIPADLFVHTPALKSISGFFRGCGNSSNTAVGIQGSIPAGLFSNLPDLQTADYVFSGCYRLSEDIATGVFVPGDLFNNSKQVTSVKAMFQYVPVTTVAADTFRYLEYLNDISYMFNYSDRSNLVLPASTFRYNNNIQYMQYFMGDPVNTTTQNGVATFQQWFIPFNGEQGIHALVDASYAFANNVNAEWADANQTMDFWDTTIWNNSKSPNLIGVYNRCNSLQNYDNIPNDYI